MAWENLAEEIREEFAAHEEAELESAFVLQLMADRKAKAEAKAKTPRKYKPAAQKRTEEKEARKLERALRKRFTERIRLWRILEESAPKKEEETMEQGDPRIELLTMFCRIFERLLPPLDPAPAPAPPVRKVAPASPAPAKVSVKKKVISAPNAALGSRLIRVVAEHFKVNEKTVLNTNQESQKEARGVLWFLLQDTAGYNQADVAKLSGRGTDTVRYWTRIIEKKRQESPELQRLLSELRQQAERGA